MALQMAKNSPFGVISCLPRRISYVLEGQAMNTRKAEQPQ